MNGVKSAVTAVEIIKQDSQYLRGTLLLSLADPLTGAIADDDTHISKFHGIYQQDDRDIRGERSRQKLEPDFGFMIRARTVAGRFTAKQWLQLDKLATQFAGSVIRLTTRQTFQFHGVKKKNLQACVQGINQLKLDTLAACGDVNRNVMCAQRFDNSEVALKTWQTAMDISERLTPKTNAYAETWLGAQGAPATADKNEEPFYGSSYLPRKFKMAIAIPPLNDVDVYTQDLGLIAIETDGQLIGYNVSVGGGMGVTHGDSATYPRLGSVIGFVSPEQVVKLAEHIVAIQRDNGNRAERKNARLKYTIDRLGLNWFRQELELRSGITLKPALPASFGSNNDQLGWRAVSDNLHNLTLFIPGGRILDQENYRLLTCLREIATLHDGEICFTANQNLVIAGITEAKRQAIHNLLTEHQVSVTPSVLGLANSMACVALPTCALAMSEAERVLPAFSQRLSELIIKHEVSDLPPSLRITGCPNGCARPYVAEIALIGKAPGRYNLMLGGSASGDRLNCLYRENIDEAGIFSILDELLGSYARQRQASETFGDFFFRSDDLQPLKLREV